MSQGERSLFKSFILAFNNAQGLTADGVRGRHSQSQQSSPKVSADVLNLDPCSDLRSEIWDLNKDLGSSARLTGAGSSMASGCQLDSQDLANTRPM